MIPYTPIHEIHLGPIKMQVWGLLVAIGIIVALFLALRRAKKLGIKKAWIYDLTFYSILFGLVGSRIGYVLFSWPTEVPLTLLNALNITNGGLSFTFGFLAAAIADVIYMKMKKIQVFRLADFMAPYIVLAHTVGRVGCFLIGDHIGKATDFFLGVIVNGTARHNVALYEIFILVFIFAVLVYLRRFKAFDGFIAASYLALYSALRFPLEFLRTDPTYYGFTAAQYVLTGLFTVSVLFLVINRLKDE